MRAALALFAALLVLVAAGVPHHHDGVFGRHACVACTSGGAESAEPQTPDVAPAPSFTPLAAEAPEGAPATGAPLGAVPGQSPPVA